MTRFALQLTMILVLVFIAPSRVFAATGADVIVYGSTPGGFCAAIAAAREGASVILLEPTDHVGGMNTGGLSHCDSNQMVRDTVMGLFDEWHTRVVKDYTDRGLKAPYNPAVKDQSRWTFEPHVAMRVTMQMLDEAGVTVLTGRYLQVGDERRPADHVAGHEERHVLGQGLCGRHLRGRPDGGGRGRLDDRPRGPRRVWRVPCGQAVPEGENGRSTGSTTGAGCCRWSRPTTAGPGEAGDENIMTYSFRLCLTTDPKNRIPMPEPDNYDPARFEMVRRYLEAGGNSNQVGFDLYPLPGGKFDGNNSIGRQFSIGLVGGGNGWHAADEAGRKAIWEAHKQYTLEFYHFLTTDPAVPKKMRDHYAEFGLCADEFASHGHFPPALYVRESRRMKGMYVISQKDILDEPAKDDPIAISSFPIDSHDCQRIALKGGGVINEGTIFPVRKRSPKQGYAYHVPYRAILPMPGQCDNLLVPVALSCTHVGISSLRIEGTWMVIGQGAGIAAALSAKEGVAVQELPYAKLRERLLAQGQVLDLPAAAGALRDLPGVLDDADAELTGTWKKSTNFTPHVGSGYVHDDRQGDGKSQAVFRYRAPQDGEYELLMAYSPHETRARNVPVLVTSGTREERMTVDQTRPMPPGSAFRLVGKIQLEAGVETRIKITNSGTDGFVIVDALRLLPARN